jgi:hypothetical protein
MHRVQSLATWPQTELSYLATTPTMQIPREAFSVFASVVFLHMLSYLYFRSSFGPIIAMLIGRSYTSYESQKEIRILLTTKISTGEDTVNVLGKWSPSRCSLSSQDHPKDGWSRSVARPLTLIWQHLTSKRQGPCAILAPNCRAGVPPTSGHAPRNTTACLFGHATTMYQSPGLGPFSHPISLPARTTLPSCFAMTTRGRMVADTSLGP